MMRGSLQKLIHNEIIKKQRKNIFKKCMATSTRLGQNEQVAQTEDDIIVKSSFPNIEMPDWTVDQYVWRNYSKWGDKVAVVSCSDPSQII